MIDKASLGFIDDVDAQDESDEFYAEDEQKDTFEEDVSDCIEKEVVEAENAKREEYLAQQRAQGTNLQNTGNSAPKTFTLNTDDSWYFYNTATKNAGKTGIFL